jgi:hypothetical protein
MDHGLIRKGSEGMTPAGESKGTRGLSGRCKVQPLWGHIAHKMNLSHFSTTFVRNVICSDEHLESYS